MGKHRFLSLFALVSLLPVLLAFILLKAGWFQSGVTNHGRWFEQEIRLLQPIAPGAAHWRLVYALPANCTEHCAQVLQLMHNIQLALGRKNAQLDLVVLASQPPVVALPAGIALLSPAEFKLTDQQLVLVEQQGLALLDYPLPAENHALPMLGKALLADLQKLMKFDRGPV